MECIQEQTRVAILPEYRICQLPSRHAHPQPFAQPVQCDIQDRALPFQSPTQHQLWFCQIRVLPLTPTWPIDQAAQVDYLVPMRARCTLVEVPALLDTS